MTVASRQACEVTPQITYYMTQQLAVGHLQDRATQAPTAYGGPFNVLNQPTDSGTTHMSIVDGEQAPSHRPAVLSKNASDYL